jgi:hypothetical protein
MLPPYYAASRMVAPSSFTAGLQGILFSPSRGFLVFTPVMVFAISGFVLSLREPEQRPLQIAVGIIVVGIVSIIAAWPEGWWGGHSFGPRLMTDVVPFLAYFVTFISICRPEQAGGLACAFRSALLFSQRSV